MKSPEHRLFVVAMWWRIGYGVLRIIFGLAVLKVVGMPLIDVVSSMMGHELNTDPNDMLYSFINSLLINHPVYVTYFLSFYFIFWGIVDVVLSYNLIKHRLWAFPMSVLLIALFILYELVRFGHTHSKILLAVMIVDICILWFIWREYKKIASSVLPSN